MYYRAYHDVATSGPAGVLEALPGAEHLAEYLAVREGEDVVVAAEYTVDPVVVQAISVAARGRGARVSILLVEPFRPGGFGSQDPPPSVIAAYERADAIVSCTWWAEVHTRPLFFTEVKDWPGRLAALHQAATVGMFATGARLPPAIFYEIKARVLDRVTAADQIRVTTPQGTDLIFSELVVDTDNGPLTSPGTWSPFPYGGVNWYPGATHGVAVIEESTVTGVPDHTLRLHFESNEVVQIEGAPEDVKHFEVFSPSGYYMRHAFVGLNPKVRRRLAPQFEREKRAGAFYFGVDARSAADRSGPGYAHCDCQFDRPTIDVDGERLVDEGRLLALDEPSVREMAAQFGDPDRILADNPVLW